MTKLVQCECLIYLLMYPIPLFQNVAVMCQKAVYQKQYKTEDENVYVFVCVFFLSCH